jgi:hypothetical protein
MTILKRWASKQLSRKNDEHPRRQKNYLTAFDKLIDDARVSTACEEIEFK